MNAPWAANPDHWQQNRAHRRSVSNHSGLTLVVIDGRPAPSCLSTKQFLAKRCLDIALAGIALVGLGALLVLVAMLIKASGP